MWVLNTNTIVWLKRLQRSAEAKTEAVDRRKWFEKVSRLKLQQLNLLRPLTATMKRLEAASHFDLIVKKVENELKEAVISSKRWNIIIQAPTNHFCLIKILKLLLKMKHNVSFQETREVNVLKITVMLNYPLRFFLKPGIEPTQWSQKTRSFEEQII